MSPLERVRGAGDEIHRPCENGGANKWRILLQRMQRKGVIPPCSSGPSNPDSKNLLFGRPLFSVCDEDKRLPKPIRDVLSELWSRGPATEGVFRKAGNAKLLAEVKAQLDSGADLDTENQSVVLLAALLKDFLRQLPGGLLGAPLYQAWVSAMEREDTQARCRELRLVSERLPRANVRLLQWLLGVLRRVSQSAHFNKMDARNLAVCVAPNLLPLNSLCLDKLEKMTVLTQFLIERCEDIFTDSLQTKSKERTEDQLADSTDSLLSHGQDSAYDSADPEADVEAGRDRPEAPPTGPSPGPASRRPSRPVSRRRSEPSMLRSAGMRTLLKLARGQEEDQQARPLRKQNSHDSFLLPHGGQTTPPLPLRPGSSSSPSPSPSPGSSPCSDSSSLQGSSPCSSISTVCLKSAPCSVSEGSLLLSTSPPPLPHSHTRSQAEESLPLHEEGR